MYIVILIRILWVGVMAVFRGGNGCVDDPAKELQSERLNLFGIHLTCFLFVYFSAVCAFSLDFFI